MHEFSFLANAQGLPRPGDPERAETGRARWQEAAARTDDPALAAFAAELADDSAGRALLAAVFGNSPFLSQCLVLEIAFARRLLVEGPDKVLEALLAELRGPVAAEGRTDSLMRALRVARRRMALLAGLADIAGLWGVERMTRALSDFADAALQAAMTHLLRTAAEAGELSLSHPDDPQRESGLTVIALGKLGSQELNYSSDIDLIVLYDEGRITFTGKSSPRDFCIRLTRDLVRVMEERTADGYVFRTDLRLRPDPSATPLALSVTAAETYYESMGQNWERAAMIRARPVAGDRELGETFVQRLRPYIWRKYLDFAAIQDIHSIKRQIHAHRGGGEIAVAGHNIKLGRGGIREIEFFAQTQQLIWGGRDVRLRTGATMEALAALATVGRIESRVAREMIEAYRFLRRVEHRLQMIDDRQTHVLPTDRKALEGLACFLGCDGIEAFTDELLAHLRRVESHYAELFEEAPPLSGPGNLVFTGIEPDPDTLETLTALGFRDGPAIWSVVRGWHHGRYRSTRSARAREILTEIMPTLLSALGRTASPDAAFMKFDDFLARLPAGVQLFSLFHAHPELLDLVAEIMGSAPRLAEHLSRNPHLFDHVLEDGFYQPLPPASVLAGELARALGQAVDFQDVLDITRRWKNDCTFQVGVQVLRNVTNPDAAGPALSDLADVVISALQPRVEAEFARQSGRVKGGGLVVLGLGKLGSREMMDGSDLDLVFVYDNPKGAEASDGRKALPVHTYYARLGQRLINAITAPTGEGRLYEIDMRLRPSGNAGPLASSLQAFIEYHEGAAWTWEHMALTRARAVSGPIELCRRVEAAIRKVLVRPRDAGELAVHVADMRERMAREHRAESIWQIKHVRGGLVDLDFIAQYLQLLHAAEHPEILTQSTSEVFRRATAIGLLPEELARELDGSGRLLRRVQGFLRLCYEGPFPEESAPAAVRNALARAAGVPDFATLKTRLAGTTKRVRAHFAELIEAPADAARAARGQAQESAREKT